MQRGQVVEVMQAFEGKRLMVVVEWTNRLVYVCRRSEFSRATSEHRNPKSTGFPREFVRELDHEG